MVIVRCTPQACDDKCVSVVTSGVRYRPFLDYEGKGKDLGHDVEIARQELEVYETRHEYENEMQLINRRVIERVRSSVRSSILWRLKDFSATISKFQMSAASMRTELRTLRRHQYS